MNTFDLSPLFRSTIGFDRLNRLLESAARVDDAAPSYPPYNIEAVDEDSYRIVMAVAGFGEDDLSVTVEQDRLTVAGKLDDTKDEGVRHLHRGIAERGFERRFQLADHMKVTAAALVNGLLHIDLVREVPEALKPRTVAITNGGKPARTIEG